jgi:hypothetical protein
MAEAGGGAEVHAPLGAARTPASHRRRPDREALAELISAASYGTVLVLAALGTISLTQVDLGHGAELIAGVGLATWIAHLFAELLAGHARHHEPLQPAQVRSALRDGSPILLAPVLPAIALMLGRFDIVGDDAARVVAILVATLQLVAIGILVGQISPGRRASVWIYAAATSALGVLVCVLTVVLGH